MKAAAFEYHAPRTLSEATDLLARLADARILAGGQSLVPAMALRVASPAHLIDINGIDALKAVYVQDGYLHVPACVRHAAFEDPPHPGRLGVLLAKVVGHIGHYPIRTRGTVCGSLANADPASEWCLVAATLDAEMFAASRRGERVIAARDWFRGLMSTALEADELLCRVRLRLLPEDCGFGFEEFSRRAGDFALAMSLVVLRREAGRIADPRVGVGAAEATPRRMAAAENELRGQKPSDTIYRRAADAAAEALDPLQDPRYDGGYRRDLVRTVVRRALEQACPVA